MGQQQQRRSMSPLRLEERDFDPGDVAVELPGGERLTYARLLAAVGDPATPPPTSSPKGALVELLRLAKDVACVGVGARSRDEAEIARPWWNKGRGESVPVKRW